MKSKTITVALAGNPNSGKTTIFNTLTGSHQHVGNYSGVTVERKEGRRLYKGYEICFVDLPGTYSLTAYSTEEVVSRDFIIKEHPDVVIDVIDSSNLERNLYLSVQILEMNVPLVLAFNMSDIAEQKGMVFDDKLLSGFFHAPIVCTVGNRNKGMNDLLDTVIETSQKHTAFAGGIINYGEEIEEEIKKIEALLAGEDGLAGKYDKRWLAVKLLEQDKDILDRGHSKDVVNAAAKSVERLADVFGDEPDIVLADRRYGFISGCCMEAVKTSPELRHNASDLADKVILNRILGLPIFAGLMYIVFKLTFWVGDPIMGWIESFFGWLSDKVVGFWPTGADSPLLSLIVDGLIGGVGGVIVFLPNILLLFLAIAILEDSGYMARAAFVMDRLMHRIGLHGKSFIPMLIGFGCSIPAIMGTRILENRQSRLTTIMVIPLMSCGARLPIYALIIPAFFAPKWHGLMLWLIYVVGIVLAVICAKLLRHTLFKGDNVPFVMELPPYRLPTLRGILTHMWQRSGLYLKKAGTIILTISVILWVLTSYPKIDEQNIANMTKQQVQQARLQYSVAGRIGKAMEPVIKPMGFDYRIGTALIGALAAKEVFVAQMGIVYSIGETDEESETLRAKLKDNYTPLQGFCIMLFCLISAPCIATLAICKRETNSWKWALFQFGGLTAMAYVITTVVFQVGSILIG